nr:MAG TPA: hypothetical protein [Bacteriophage sp.]
MGENLRHRYRKRIWQSLCGCNCRRYTGWRTFDHPSGSTFQRSTLSGGYRSGGRCGC